MKFEIRYYWFAAVLAVLHFARVHELWEFTATDKTTNRQLQFARVHELWDNLPSYHMNPTMLQFARVHELWV